MDRTSCHPREPLRILLAVQRPLLRRGLLHWLGEKYPTVPLECIDDVSQLLAALRRHRPHVLLTEPGLLSKARIADEHLPRVLLLNPGQHCVGGTRTEPGPVCAQIGDGLDDASLQLALDRVLNCPRERALDCANDACELRASCRPNSLGLSGRELDVFRRLGAGEAPREIAATLGLSVKTVEHYRAQIKDKLALRDSRELLEFAVLWRRGLASHPSQVRSP